MDEKNDKGLVAEQKKLKASTRYTVATDIMKMLQKSLGILFGILQLFQLKFFYTNVWFGFDSMDCYAGNTDYIPKKVYGFSYGES